MGSIRFDGQEIRGRQPHQVSRAGISRTFQLSNVFVRMTVLENLLLGARPGRADSLRGALLGTRRWREWERTQVEKARSLLARLRTLRPGGPVRGELVVGKSASSRSHGH